MTLTIPLDEYAMRTDLTIDVELTDDGSTVELSIDLEPGEFASAVRPVVSMPPVASEAPDTEIGQARHALMRATRSLEVVETERDALRDALERVREAQYVARRLLPEEARALAAALWHYAGEAEAR